MKWNNKELKTYPEIIETALKLKGDEQKDFVEQCAKSGPYALQNVGYFSGYYDSEKAIEIMKIFKTAHPIFGTRRVSPEEALEMGKRMAMK